MSKTQVILVRHAETTWNLESRYQGQLDSPLTERGILQAKALADRLRQIDLDQIYASDLGRAMHTAEKISAASGHTVGFDPRLRERHFGIFHGLQKPNIPGKYPEEYRAFTSGDPDYVPPEGESLQQLHDRSLACLEELADRHAGQRLVLVTHGGVLGALIKHVLGLPVAAPRPFKLVNASLSILVAKKNRWMATTLGDVAHLQRLEGVDDIV